jgi:hypothetical protein
MTAALLGEMVPVGIGAAKVGATLLAAADFFPPFFPLFYGFPVFLPLASFDFVPAWRAYARFAGIRRVKFCSAAFLLNPRSQGQYILK